MEACTRDAECNTYRYNYDDNYNRNSDQYCKDGRCVDQKVNGSACTRNMECDSWNCDPKTFKCAEPTVGLGKACTRDSECAPICVTVDDECDDYETAFCGPDPESYKRCTSKLDNGADCTSNDQCQSNNCVTDSDSGTCAIKPVTEAPAGSPTAGDNTG